MSRQLNYTLRTDVTVSAKKAIYFSFPYEFCCELAGSAVFFGAELYTLSEVNPEVSAEAAARYLPEWF